MKTIFFYSNFNLTSADNKSNNDMLNINRKPSKYCLLDVQLLKSNQDLAPAELDVALFLLVHLIFSFLCVLLSLKTQE